MRSPRYMSSNVASHFRTRSMLSPTRAATSTFYTSLTCCCRAHVNLRPHASLDGARGRLCWLRRQRTPTLRSSTNYSATHITPIALVMITFLTTPVDYSGTRCHMLTLARQRYHYHRSAWRLFPYPIHRLPASTRPQPSSILMGQNIRTITVRPVLVTVR